MNETSVDERTVVITGATSGLGRECARELAALPGWTVVVAARDAARGAAVARALGPRHVTLPLDLDALASVRTFPSALAAASLPPLGAIVANAGVQYRDRRHTTADGFEATFGVNHLAHFQLLRLLLPHLAERGRVVITASGTHRPQRLRNLGFPPPRWREPAELATPGEGSGQVAYATSKLANVLTALELARRAETLRPGAEIAVHAFDPGLMPDTGLVRGYPRPLRSAYRRLEPLLARTVPGVTTAAASGAQLARMVADPAYAAPPHGRYVELTRDGEPSPLARDAAVAARLWSESERLVGLAPAGV